ncbi:DUF4163 domain-containing protein [Qipengyuania sp. SM2507]
MNPRLFLIAALLSSAACSDTGEMEERLGTSAEASASATTPLPPGTEAGEGRAIAETTDDYEFEYSWPGEANSIPALATLLQGRADGARADLVETTREDRAAAAEGDYPYRPHSFLGDWQLVADIPGWLSLSGTISTYAGGAHPNTGFDSLLWDKSAGVAREPLDLFRSPQNLQNAIARRFCTMLDAERGERRGEPVDRDADDYFSACPGVEELTVLLGSSDGETFDRVSIWVMPYVAGPYAEGSYEFDLPVDTALLDAVKPGYEKAFSLGPQG